MVGIRMGMELSDYDVVTTEEVVANGSNEFYISASEDANPGEGILEGKFSTISLDEDSIYMNDIRLYIHKSKTASMEIKLVKDASGKSRKDAANNAKMTNFNYRITDSSISLSNYLSFPKEHKIRGQQVKFKLYLPVGKSIYLDNSLRHIIHNVANVTDTWDPHMLGKKWVMLDEGLTCLDCSEIEGITSAQLDSIRAYEPVIEVK